MRDKTEEWENFVNWPPWRGGCGVHGRAGPSGRAAGTSRVRATGSDLSTEVLGQTHVAGLPGRVAYARRDI